ncbi:hypothetical protein IAT38_002410 [Cryptococcus sp. DSM 104549]
MSSKQGKSTDSPKKKKVEAAPVGADIRNFNTPKSQTSQAGTAKKQPITIDDSDDEDVKPVTKAGTTSKHFGSTGSKKPIALSSDEDAPAPPSKPKPQSKSKPPTPKAKPTATGATKRKALVIASDDDEDGDEEVKPRAAKRQSLGGVKKPNYVESSDEEDEGAKWKGKGKAVAPAGKGKGKDKAFSPMDVDDEFDDLDFGFDVAQIDDEPAPKVKAKPAVKAKEAPAPVVQKPAPAPAAVKKSPAKKPAAPAKKEKEEPADGEEKKPAFNWRAAAAAKAAGPKAPGSKDIPEGAPDCLAGLTFVFTGELESLGREEAQELVRRYSGKVTGAPSGKTSYVVIGENAGASKLNKIKEKKIPTMTEDEFLDFIRTRSSSTAQGGVMDAKALGKAEKAREKEEKKIEEAARAMEAREKEEEKERRRKEKVLKGQGMAVKKIAPPSSQLWTTKYAPTSIKEICGNRAPVERLSQWLQDWQKNAKSGFKKPGKDGMGVYRAVLISGPPGIGKTTSAHLVAKAAGYNPLELNASDARSKKLVENETNIDNTSLDGFFKGTGVQSTTAAGIRVGERTCLIMDEVDGMSAGDRGGVGALNTLIKKTKIPMILICNDRSLQKMKPLIATTFNMTFKRPQPNEIRSRIMSVLFKEKLKIPANVVDELVKGVNSDIRQVLNMLSTFKLGKSEMDFDEGKQLVKLNEKNTVMTPFAIIDKLTGPYAFSKTNRDTLSDRMELYFHDFSFVPLFMQEHYLKTNPAALNNTGGKEKDLKHLELISKAADSISDGDLIDRMIHGSEQHWSLLPLHAVASTVKPAMCIYGSMRSQGGGWGSWGPAFPQWLGQNSKQNKLGRMLTDIQIRMRLRASGSRAEIREQYMPLLASKIVLPLTKKGADAVDETIDVMDEYFLGKEDWDAFVELGVDTMDEKDILKKIPTAAKSAFTRQYNKKDHPIAFHKGDMFAASKKKIADTGPAPDNEDVFEDDEPAPEDPDEKDDDDDDGDLSKDKMIKAVKPKGKAAAGKAAAGKATAKAPAKGKGKAK